MLKRFRQFCWGCFRQIWNLEFLCLIVLHTPDAAEVMVAVGSDGGVVCSVAGSARIVVDYRLVIKIDDVKRAIRTNASMNRTEPKIAAANKLFFLSRVAR